MPKYKGLNTHEKALEAKDKFHGASVHFVNSRLDDGPIIIQSKCIVDPNDTCETLKAKVHKLNTRYYLLQLIGIVRNISNKLTIKYSLKIMYLINL